MAYTPEPYVVEQADSLVFSEVINCEEDVRPSWVGKEHDMRVYKKRLGLAGNPNWITDGNIISGFSVGDKVFMYTDEGKVYTFDGNTLTDLEIEDIIYDSSKALPDIFQVAFLWWGRFPDEATEYTVTWYSGTTITISETDLDAEYIGKYVYIATSDDAQWQYAGIQDIPNNNQIRVDVDFAVNPANWDKLYIYNDIRTQLWFPQLRRESDEEEILALDLDENVMFWYYPNNKKFTLFDNRVVSLHRNNTSILVSANRNYEIIDLTKIITNLSQEALNIDTHNSYVMIYFRTAIGLLRKEVIDQITGDFIYKYQDWFKNLWLYSEESFLSTGSNLYIFTNFKRLYSVDIETSTVGEVTLREEEQGRELYKYFDDLPPGRVKFYRSLGTLRMVHIPNEIGKTTVFRLENDKWYVDEYNKIDNFMWFFNSLGSFDYTCHENKVYRRSGLLDDWENIRQYLKMYWPASFIDRMFMVYQIRYLMGVNGNPMYAKFIVSTGGTVQVKQEVDLDSLDIVWEINNDVSAWPMWSNNMWDETMWWEPWVWDPLNYYGEYIMLSQKVGRQWWYCTVEIINDSEKDFVLRQVLIDVLPWTPTSTPNNTIMHKS